jgi:hypothetical protein
MVTARTPLVAHERGRGGPLLRRTVVVLLALLIGTAWAADRVAVPGFPARAGVPIDLGDRFSEALRGELFEAGVSVAAAPLITPGIAGSLEVEFARLVAELEGARYAMSGEVVARPGVPGAPFAVNVLIVDNVQGRSSDVLSWSLAVATLPRVAADVAAFVLRFVDEAPELPAGDAALFVSTVPRAAEVRIDGVPVGVSGVLDVISLQPGRYELEVRLEGYLPEVRTVDLRSSDTRFVHVVLTEVSGGSIRVTSVPNALVYLDDAYAGPSPVTLTSLPGDRTVRVERPGFEGASFGVGVRNFRVHRIDAVLTPLSPTMLVWPWDAPGSVIVGGVLRRDGYATVDVGLVSIERVRDGAVQRVLRAVPARGLYWLDLDTLDLTPLVD